jgi:hypothetical protein
VTTPTFGQCGRHIGAVARGLLACTIASKSVAEPPVERPHRSRSEPGRWSDPILCPCDGPSRRSHLPPDRHDREYCGTRQRLAQWSGPLSQEVFSDLSVRSADGPTLPTLGLAGARQLSRVDRSRCHGGRRQPVIPSRHSADCCPAKRRRYFGTGLAPDYATWRIR